MEKIFLVGLLVLLGGCDLVMPVEREKNVAQSEKMSRVVWNEREFLFASAVVEADNLVLAVNLPEKKTSQEIIDNQGCGVLINGGFYSKEEEPIGWMHIMGEMSLQAVRSQLLDGFLSVGDEGVVIDRSVPVGQVEVGVQSGPILVENGKPVKLSIKNDAGRRRMVAALDTNGELVFIGVVEPESRMTGPRLADLPNVLVAIGEELGKEWQSAINLDGGTASAYYDGIVYLPEANPIGSYFCVRER